MEIEFYYQFSNSLINKSRLTFHPCKNIRNREGLTILKVETVM